MKDFHLIILIIYEQSIEPTLKHYLAQGWPFKYNGLIQVKAVKVYKFVQVFIYI